MDKQKSDRGIVGKVTAVVPAYNEAPRIGAVLDVLLSYPGFQEVIVIDDGSTDGTGEVAAARNLRVVRNETNMGKGYSMDRGVALAETDIIFFSDADIEGLTHEIIEEILAPVQDGSADMFIGMCNRKWYIVHEILTFVPLLGGERAVTKTLWMKLPSFCRENFRPEVALNFFSIYYGKGYRYKILPNIVHIKKEKKYGFMEGVRSRLWMYYEVFSTQIRLNFSYIPLRAKSGRWLALVALSGAVGAAVGIFIFTALYFGPIQFIRSVFAEDLRDPTSLLAPLLLKLAYLTPIDTIALVGLFIFITGVIIFILTWKNLNYLWYGFLHKAKNGEKLPKM